jgi:hypothetical protein
MGKIWQKIDFCNVMAGGKLIENNLEVSGGRHLIELLFLACICLGRLRKATEDQLEE